MWALVVSVLLLVGTVAYQWMDLITYIQRSRAPVVCENIPCSITICLRYRHECKRSGHAWCIRLSSVYFCLSLHTITALHIRGPMPICPIAVSQLVAFHTKLFLNTFLIGCDPQIYTAGGRFVMLRSPSRLFFYYKYVISDSISKTHQMPRAVDQSNPCHRIICLV